MPLELHAVAVGIPGPGTSSVCRAPFELLYSSGGACAFRADVAVGGTGHGYFQCMETNQTNRLIR